MYFYAIKMNQTKKELMRKNNTYFLIIRKMFNIKKNIHCTKKKLNYSKFTFLEYFKEFNI